VIIQGARDKDVAERCQLKLRIEFLIGDPETPSGKIPIGKGLQKMINDGNVSKLS
jgi:hypothetical protein